MALQASGLITIADIQAEFGGVSPIGIQEYYRGGAYVPDTPENASIPMAGAISLADFYNSQSSFVATITQGSTPFSNATSGNGFIGSGSQDHLSGTPDSVIGALSPNAFNGVPLGSIYKFTGNPATLPGTRFILITDPGSHTVRSKTGVFTSIDVEGIGILNAADADFRPANAFYWGNLWYWTLSTSGDGAPSWDGTGTRTVAFT